MKKKYCLNNLVPLLVLVALALTSYAEGKNRQINYNGFQNYMDDYFMQEDFEKTFVQTTDEGTMTLKLYKPVDSHRTNTVWGTVVIESEEEFKDGSDLRLCLEFGRRDHFMLHRRRRYALYGDPEAGNFTDFTIATELSSKINLTSYNWWCRPTVMDKRYRYDFYDYTSSFYLQNVTNANVISKTQKQVTFKFKTEFEQNEYQQVVMSWGLFPNKYSNDSEYVYATHQEKENVNGSYYPEVHEFHIGYIHPPYFSKVEIQILDYIMWDIVYWWANWFPFPLFGPMVQIPFFILQRNFFNLKTIYFFWYTVFISTDNVNYKEYNLGNWAWYLLLSSFIQWLLYPWIILISAIPIFNWLNFFPIWLYFYVIAY